MPLIEPSTYTTSRVFKNGHINCIYAALFRTNPPVQYHRERISTPDGDFLDLDWSKTGSNQLIIALHGLEGDADRPYIRAMVKYFNDRGWDALGVNFRGCSGEPNLQVRSYHIGETGDLRQIIDYSKCKGYKKIALVGFSLGGNVLLKYLGENALQVPNEVIGGVAFSVPCDVKRSNIEIDKWHNRHYLKRFLITLNKKMKQKAGAFPDQIWLPNNMPRDFKTFDDLFTAPIHGFNDADHYWSSSSSLQFLPTLCRPALLVNSLDDTFLAETCYPYELAKAHSNFFLETPSYGGHVGFVSKSRDGHYWSEQRAFEFVESMC